MKDHQEEALRRLFERYDAERNASLKIGVNMFMAGMGAPIQKSGQEMSDAGVGVSEFMGYGLGFQVDRDIALCDPFWKTQVPPGLRYGESFYHPPGDWTVRDVRGAWR